MSECIVDGWYSGDKKDHYFKDGIALCHPNVKPGESVLLRDDGERRYCGGCAQRVRWMRRKNTPAQEPRRGS